MDPPGVAGRIQKIRLEGMGLFFPSVELCIMFHLHFRRNRISSVGATVLCLEAAAVVVGCQAEAVLRLLVTRLPIRR